MKPVAIVYSSNTGYTQRYAQMLSNIINLPVVDLKDAKKTVKRGSDVIYMSWLMAGRVKNFKKAKGRYNLTSLIAVCLGPTGSQLDSVRKNCKLDEHFPAFTVQGGMDRSKLKGLNRVMINMLVKMLTASDDKSEGEQAMLDMIIKGGDFVSEEHLTSFIKWYNNT